jgi:hypothetical protein
MVRLKADPTTIPLSRAANVPRFVVRAASARRLARHFRDGIRARVSESALSTRLARLARNRRPRLGQPISDLNH